MRTYPFNMTLVAVIALASLSPRDLTAQFGTLSVTPDGNTTPNRTANTSGYSETFTVTNNNSSYDEAWISCGGLVNVTCTGVSQSLVPLDPWESVLVTAYYDVGNPGDGELSLSAFSEISESSDDGYYNVPVVGLNAPEVDWAPYNADNQDMSRCAASCFAATYAHGTVPYYTFDTPQSVTLVYHGDRVDPKPFIHVNARYTGSPQPIAFRLRLKKANGTFVAFLNGDSTLRFQPSANWVRLAGQFDAAANGMGSTEVYNVTVVVGAEWANGVGEQTLASTLIVVNESASPIARGWTLAGIQRLYPQADGSALITEGEGSAVYFKKSGSTFLAPAGEFSKLQTHGTNEWVRSYPDSTKVYFRSDGRMRDAIDRFGNDTRVRYDGTNRVQWIDDPWAVAYGAGSGSLLFTYGAYGVASIRDNLGGSANWRYAYFNVNASQWLTQVTDPDGVYTSLGYDGAGRLQTITNRRGYAPGFTTTLAYDAQSGKLASVTGPPSLLFEGVVSPVTSFANWHKVSVPYDSTSGTPFSPVLASNVQGSVTDPGTHTTSFTANKWGQPLVSTDPLSRTTTMAYTADGMPFSIQYPSGGTDVISYNSDGLPESVTPAGATQTRIHYAAWALADSIWGTGQPRQRMWVAAGKVDSVETGPSGSATRMRYRYDAQGRVGHMRDPLGHVDSAEYQGTYGNRNRTIRPGNRITTYLHDVYGRDTAVTPPGMPTRRVQYDRLNRDTTVYDGVYATPTRFAYDLPYGPNEYIAVRVTDPKGQVYDEFRNAVGWVTTRRDPTVHDDIYWYDRDGLLQRQTNRRGQAIDVDYDPLHRLTWRGGTGLADAWFSYQSNGLVVRDSNAYVANWTYLNGRGQPDSVLTGYCGSCGYYRLRYAYTGAGLLDSLWAWGSFNPPFLTRKYGYNTQRGTLDSIQLGGALTRFSLNGDLQPSSVTFPGADQVTRSFTALHGEMVISSSAPYSMDIKRKITLDTQGRLWRQLRDSLPGGNGVGHLYGYDGLGRLKADTAVAKSDTTAYCLIENPNAGVECGYDFWSKWYVMSRDTFAYDQVGNRLDRGGEYTNPGNRITAFDGCSYATDADGNVTRRSCPGRTDSIVWDALNRPTRFLVNGVAYDLFYDASGRPVRQDSAGVVRGYFLWDGDHLFAELDVPGNKRTEYSYYPGLDNLHAVITGSTPAYGHYDGLGNVVALTRADQTLAGVYGYDAWGAIGAYFKGAQRILPEVEFYYMRNRWYEPKTGRFLSEDPIGLDGGINPYTFAGNDPINGRDPTGLTQSPCVDWYWVSMDAATGEVLGSTYWKTTGSCGGGGGAGPSLPRWTVNPPPRWPAGFRPPAPGGRPPAGNPEPGPTVSGCVAASMTAAFSLASDVLFFTGIGAAGKVARLALVANRGGTKMASRAAGELARRQAQRVASGGRIHATAQGMAHGVIGMGMSGTVSGMLGDPIGALELGAAFLPIFGTVGDIITAVGCWAGR